MTTRERIVAAHHPTLRWYGPRMSLGHALAQGIDPARVGWKWAGDRWAWEEENAGYYTARGTAQWLGEKTASTRRS